jgi:hypothetical protein
MMLSKPIPRALLPHSAILKTPRKDGIFDDGDYDEVILRDVRVEVSTKRTRLYFDTVNSMPRDMKFRQGQLLGFCDKDYKIDEIKAVMCAGKIHHYRIEMT